MKQISEWRGIIVDVERLYALLTECGWKVDTEESNLMIAFSKTWRFEGIKVWVYLKDFVCAPPFGESEALDTITFYRFDPTTMPTETMEQKTYDPGDEKQDWYPNHREEWDWLICNGDPQTDTFELLTAIPVSEVPPGILQATMLEFEEAVGQSILFNK
jgi:hypothetical protein